MKACLQKKCVDWIKAVNSRSLESNVVDFVLERVCILFRSFCGGQGSFFLRWLGIDLL